MTPLTLRQRPLLCPDLSRSTAFHPVLARIYATRVTDATDLLLRWEALPPFRLLTDLDRAARRLADAVQDQEQVVIAGDYDADGATATAVLVRAIRGFGGTADFVVPDRITEGYGLSPALAQRLLRLKPQLVITVDNGIASHEGVAVLQAAQVPVIVTDHHLPGPTLPEAYAIVNPQRAGDPFPSKGLAGVGVAFALAVTTRTLLLERGWAQAKPSLGALLDLVALGTVADVVCLDPTNRLLVDQGLRRLRTGCGTPGIQALIATAGRDPARLQAHDLGFTVGPRLNAAGRLDDMSIGIRCLLTDDPEEARAYARTLDGLNRERRTIEGVMRSQAEALVEQVLASLVDYPSALCLHDPSWHEGVVGLVAGRIKERAHRPTVAFALSVDGTLKGSARSIPGVHIRDALALVDTRHPNLIIRFGGHAAAAGLTLPADRLADFAGALQTAVRDMAAPEAFQAVLDTDGVLASHELALETAEALAAGGPWGQGFPGPLFEGHFTVHAVRPLSEGVHARLTVTADDGGMPLTVMAFQCAARLNWTPVTGPLHCVYSLGVNDYRDARTLQLIVEAVLS